MLLNLGLIIVFASLIIGFVGSGGNVSVILQPFELVIIGGIALGSFIMSTPKDTLINVLKYLPNMKKGRAYTKKEYLQTLTFLFDFFKFARSNSLIEIEKHIEDPTKSKIFKKHPIILKQQSPLTFFCDYIRIQVLGFDRIYELENMMEYELNERRATLHDISSSILKLGDALPAFGIVAAVLGVITAMAAVGAAPNILAIKIASALVGTFLGVFLAYGVVMPIGYYLGRYGNEEMQYLECIKNALVAHLKGYPPSIAVEFGRQSIPLHLKPSFTELENKIEKLG